MTMEDEAKPELPKSRSKELKNPTLERELQGCSVVLWYSVLFLSMDVGRQIFSYGIKYHNSGIYPIPQTQIVALIETLKFSIFFTQAAIQGHARDIKMSMLFILPAFIFTVNNNVYLFVLRYTTPPVWNILVQLRMVTTPLAYRVVFKRYLSFSQWLGICIILTAVVMTNIFLGVEKKEHQSGYEYLFIVISLILTVVGSAVSSLMMEFQFKNSQSPFCVLQSQLYFYTMVGTWILYGLEYNTSPSVTADHDATIYTLIVSCIVFSAASGITIAVVSKRLDTIVKLYFQALSNILTSLACASLFPDHFQFSVNFVFCLLLMIFGVFVLEYKNIFKIRKKEVKSAPHSENETLNIKPKMT